jgi:hypothetical protein
MFNALRQWKAGREQNALAQRYQIANELGKRKAMMDNAPIGSVGSPGGIPYYQPSNRTPSIMERLLAAGEYGLMGASGAVAEPAAGIAGLAGLSEGRNGVSDIERVREALTYQPGGRLAQQGLQKVAPYAESATNWLGDKAIDLESLTGIPREAIQAGPIMALEMLGGAGMLAKANRFTRNAQSVPSRFKQSGAAASPGHQARIDLLMDDLRAQGRLDGVTPEQIEKAHNALGPGYDRHNPKKVIWGLTHDGKKAYLEDKGYYHDIGLGNKLPKPLDEFSREFEQAPLTDSANKILTPEYFEGKLMIGASGDASDIGRLTKVGDTRLSTPVDSFGGRNFMNDPRHPLEVWASDLGAVTKKDKQIIKALQEGQDPHLVFSRLGHGSMDFNTMMTQAVMRQYNLGDMPAGLRKSFDADMQTAIDTATKQENAKRLKKWKEKNKAGIKQKAFVPAKPKKWVGVTKDNLEEYLTDATGDLRKIFITTMSRQKYQKAGLPSVAETRFALTDPDLLHSGLLDSGQSIARVTGGMPVTGGFQHPTYSHNMLGEGVGRYENALPPEIQWLDFYKQRRADNKPTTSDFRAFDLTKPQQVGTPEWVDTAMKYYEERLRR